ncbi:FtsQ-type POTRA domain-containing protein [Gloeocapsopsis crepidinum LEGE 06123]|uniref:FtsQ-type POTRA domain-containing protein n=1 Tax=Gloeocapsopsis crepidinum LEGE 06123 TaxID=588587 RepID=A0ABR9UXB6_9CHRO|nr:FtsQ-type POTRA domain-containing protein [Gloeocapsopsis crepidinum]MBE9192949.1 FtsQ-type POTRA domain-containing protein [Gloeocapsopsis crepidinum LEGE 06123]
MTSIESVSRSDLEQRRKKLRTHRRLKMLQAAWQTLAVGGMLGGLVWATTQPIWVLQESSQVTIEGNQLLATPAIKSLLPVSYPQSLLRIRPEAIANSLESQPTIVDATVTRELFPPGLRVVITERIPVAIAYIRPPQAVTTDTQANMGFVDANGIWIPFQTYAAQSTNLKLPQLKVIGPWERYQSYWSSVYQSVSRSPVKISEIDCQDPTNIILKTELGIVHLGAYSSRLTQQLQVLDQMRQFPQQLNSSQIAYIDLSNPETPTVQMNQ